jgi:hypothetical protein
MEKIDCTDYDKCPKGNEIVDRLTYDTLSLIFFGCWGVYCRSKVFEELTYKWDDEKNKAKIKTEKNTYGGLEASNLMREYSERNRVDAVLIAGDNVYEDTASESILEKYNFLLREDSKKKFKKQIAKMKNELHDVEKQIRLGFVDCIKKIRSDTFLVGIGNHDVKSCNILNNEMNSKEWTLPALYYNYKYLLTDGTIVNIIFIDTNIYDDDYCNKDVDSEFFLSARLQQKKWLETILKNNSKNWNIVIGHIPFMCATHSSDENDLFRQNTLLRKDIDELYEYIDLYMCADEHNQQYLIYHPTPNIKESIPVVISGTGGAKLDKNIKLIPKEEKTYIETIFTRANFGFVSLLISKEKIDLDFHAVNPKGTILRKR